MAESRTLRTRLVFQNINGGVVARGGLGPPAAFGILRPDILCLAEVPMDAECRSPLLARIGRTCRLLERRVRVLHPSHLESEGGYLGLALLTRYTIAAGGRSFDLPDIGLVPPHRKGGLEERVILDEWLEAWLDVVVLHNHAAYRFNRRMDEPGLAGLRVAIKEVVHGASGVPVRRVIAGDFNSAEVPFDAAFPELRIGDAILRATGADTTVLGHPGWHGDQVLVSRDIAVRWSTVYWTTSDHPALIADLAVPGVVNEAEVLRRRTRRGRA